MPILAALMVPHPPMIVPAVGRGSENEVAETTRAYERAAEEVAALRPDTLIITSPHAVMYADYFHISPGSGAEGSFRRFGAPKVRFQPFKNLRKDLMEAIVRTRRRDDAMRIALPDALRKELIEEWVSFWKRQ